MFVLNDVPIQMEEDFKCNCLCEARNIEIPSSHIVGLMNLYSVGIMHLLDACWLCERQLSFILCSLLNI